MNQYLYEPDTWERTLAGYNGSCVVLLTCPDCFALVEQRRAMQHVDRMHDYD